MTTSAHQKSTGFTLIELLTVVSIAGILSGIAIVTLSKRLNQERLLSAARETHSWLESQRKLAMTNGQACEILIDHNNATLTPSTPTITLSTGESISNSCRSQAALRIRNTISNGSGITLSMTPINAQAIRFSFRGLSEINTSQGDLASQLELRLSQSGNNKTRCIKIMSPLGLIRNGSAESSSGPCNYSSSF
jgi:prepilin-type N-terminal cleavage/methylation domain-containing protein